MRGQASRCGERGPPRRSSYGHHQHPASNLKRFSETRRAKRPKGNLVASKTRRAKRPRGNSRIAPWRADGFREEAGCGW
eukprot:710219-Pyramimonas_sp.AAC.1